MLRIQTVGGLAGPALEVIEIPEVSLYGDGRIMTQGPQIEIFPGPALPNIQVARVSLEGIVRILEAARDGGLLAGDRHYDLTGIFDAGTTVFTIHVDGQRHTVSAYALGSESGHEDSIPPEELEARQRMSAFASAFFSLEWLGADVVSEGVPYEFRDIRIIVQPAEPSQEPELAGPAFDWPLDEPLSTLGEPFPMGEGARCATVSGDDLVTLLPLLQEANTETRWSSADELYSLLLRPLLPDEAGCPER